MSENLQRPLARRHVQFLAKARLGLAPTTLVGEPAVVITRECQSVNSADPGDWCVVGEPIVVPAAQLEELIFELREAAREATS